MVSSRRILLTTSRNPTRRIRTFCNDLARAIPNVIDVNRGKMSTDEVAERALELEADHVVIVERWQGGPGSIKFFRVGESGLVSVPPIIHVAGITLRREFGGVSKIKSALSLAFPASEISGELLRVADAFSKFFGLPLQSVEEANRAEASSTLIRVLHDERGRMVITFMVEPDDVEVGPRVTVSRVEW